MGDYPMPSPPPPPLLHLPNHGEAHHGGSQSFLASNTCLLIVIPLLVVMFVVGFSILIIFCRARSRKHNNISSCNSSFRKGSFDRPQMPVYSTKGSGIGYSPDVRSCIYGGRLGCSFQGRNRRGQVFTYKELEVATDGFSESNVIGNGGFGVVFRGNLSDGTVAAIKLLHREGKQGERDFRTEVEFRFVRI